MSFLGHFFQGCGGIGDDLLCSAVFRELKLRGMGRVSFATAYPELFLGNLDVERIFSGRMREISSIPLGKRLIRLGYAEYDPVQDRDLHAEEPMIATICRLSGIRGEISLRPYFYLGDDEVASGIIHPHQIVVQSSGMSGAHPMKNKEWMPSRMQAVCDILQRNYRLIQIGSPLDPPLVGCLDLRGKVGLRGAASILANAHLFIGLVGFPMHLARSVDCPSVILYGGRESPRQTGYIANKNLSVPASCAPCYLRNRCGHDHICMTSISVEMVLDAVEACDIRSGKSLPVEKFIIRDE